jgi:hypothetical protein
MGREADKEEAPFETLVTLLGLEAQCPACKRPPDAVNHVPGHVFVGWGCGWQPCPRCGGTERIPRKSSDT